MNSRGTASAVALSIALLAGGGARAQDWQAYAYPDSGFAAQFPAKPTLTEVQYQAGGVTGPAKVYSARLGATDYSVTVADLSASAAGKDAAIDAAVKAFAAAGQVKLDVSERIDRQFGRELSVLGKDGSQTATAIFYVDKKLYVLAGRGEPASMPLAVRFQQSLEFISADGKRPRRPEDGPGLGGAGGFGPPGEGGPDGGRGPGGRRRPPPQAFTDCKGKAEGAAVQHKTPRGDVVAATCIATPEGLAARPNQPLDGGPPGGPRDGPPPEG